MTDSTTTTQDPADIERDIRRTQDAMSRTVDRLGDQLTPRNLINSLLDKAEDNNIDARYLIDGARRNPLALAMIAGGAIWLVSDSDAKLPSFGSGSSSGSSQERDHADPFHRDYVAHMERIERDANEDDLAYYRRRDQHRANYFMLERGHEEDDQGFRQRLDDVADSFREKRRAWADSASEAGDAARETGSAAVSRVQQAYTSNPLIGGLLAAAAGAIFGTTLPLSRTEEDRLSGVGESAREFVGEQKDKLVSAARDKKDDLITQVEKTADRSAQRSAGSQPGESGSRYSGANDAEMPTRQLAAEEPAGDRQHDWESGNQ